MNLYRIAINESKVYDILDVIKVSKVSKNYDDGMDYIISRGIFYYSNSNAVIDIDFDFDKTINFHDVQSDINRSLCNKTKAVVRNSKLEDLLK